MRYYYMVEIDLGDASLRDEFELFYSRKLDTLLGIEGFISCQRFEATHPCAGQQLAVWEIASPEILASEAYRNSGGPQSVPDAMVKQFTYWRRNIFSAGDEDIAVSDGAKLSVIDRLLDSALPLPPGYTTLSPVSLDRHMVERGVLAREDAPPAESREWQIRQMKALMPLRAA
ncbi:MAG: hypothetical protein AAF384_14630 [Pseudomonadota bacterium]